MRPCLLLMLSLLSILFPACKNSKNGTCGPEATGGKGADAPHSGANIPAPRTKSGAPKGAKESAMSHKEIVLEIIHRRKSVRHYLKKPVPRAWLERLVRAGMAAPTAVNKQPWAFIVITKRATLDALGEKLPYAKMIKQTPAAIVVAGDLSRALPGKMLEFWIQDVSAAVENILLAAEAMGLGAVWTGVYPMEPQLKAVNEVLSLPKHIIHFAVIPIGWPDGSDKPKNKWDPQKLHWEAWGENNKPSLLSP